LDRMTIQIIHLLPNRFPYGAYAMLDELYYALNKYYGEEVEQKVLYLYGRSDPTPPHFAIPAEHTDIKFLRRTVVKEHTNPVVFYHKLSATDCKDVSKTLHKKAPFAIINHTASNTFKGIAPCDTLVCVSKQMYKAARKRLPSYKLAKIRNGVNACRYEDIQPYKPGQVKDYFVTGRLNNFNNCKHPRDWITYVKTVNLAKPLWHDYIGNGAHFKHAQNYASKRFRRPTQNVVNLPGRIDDFERKISYIKRWDTFLYEIPGTEGTSMALLEALACGVPAIINNRYGNKEIITSGVNGFVYNDRREAMRIMNDLIRRPDRLDDLKRSTKRNFLEGLDAKHMAANYYQLAKELSKGG